MPISSCDPCCSPTEMARSIELFKSSVLIILCQIADSLEPEPALEFLNASGIAGGTETIINPSAPDKSICVYAFELASAGATNLNVGFVFGGAVPWQTYLDDTLFTLRSIAAVAPPNYLFKGQPGEQLEIGFLGGSGDVVWSVAYFEM